jgi:GNAT superfamily N-acetyltransferase
MIEAAKYSTIEALRDGSSVEIRALKAADQEDMLAAVNRISGESLYRRFFGAKRYFSETEKAFFLNADFVNHLALVAIAKDVERPCVVGGGRYIVVRPGTAELAFAVIDEYQGRGIGSALMRHLVLLGRDSGIKEFVAEVLAENIPMLKVLQTSGLRLQVERRAEVIYATQTYRRLSR